MMQQSDWAFVPIVEGRVGAEEAIELVILPSMQKWTPFAKPNITRGLTACVVEVTVYKNKKTKQLQKK